MTVVDWPPGLERVMIKKENEKHEFAADVEAAMWIV